MSVRLDRSVPLGLSGLSLGLLHDALSRRLGLIQRRRTRSGCWPVHPHRHRVSHLLLLLLELGFFGRLGNPRDEPHKSLAVSFRRDGRDLRLWMREALDKVLHLLDGAVLCSAVCQPSGREDGEPRDSVPETLRIDPPLTCVRQSMMPR